jgi:RNA recognition motif-containing protein
LLLSCSARFLVATQPGRVIFLSECIDRMSKIYVGNLPFSADEEQVRTLFAQHGTVDSVALINDRETGRFRGFGFVEMPSADAARAIQSLNGKDMGGRPLKVNEAQDKPRNGAGGPRSGGGFRNGGGGGFARNGGGGGGGRW